MELNLAPVSSSATVQRPLREKPKLRGSWKKRRREEVLKRVKDNRIDEKYEQEKPAAANFQADEFDSGFDKSGSSSSKPNLGSYAPGHPRKRKRTKQNSKDLQNHTNLPVEGATAELAVQPGEGKKHISNSKGKRQAAKSQAETVKEDQAPEAVCATLAVIGTEKERKEDACTAGKGGVNDKSGDCLGTEEANGEADETFAVSSFAETGLYHSVTHHITSRLGMELPTRVQERVLKAILGLGEGKQSIDLLVRSATGSGKTLAYLLPIAHYMMQRVRRVSREDGAMAIVVVPTRELANQVEEVAQLLFRPWHWIVVGSVVGGESKKREKSRLRKGINVLIATPGRLLDHMRNTRSFRYGFCEFLVLDEADRLLDLGFEADIKQVVESLNSTAKVCNPEAGMTRCNVLLSATLRNDVERLAQFSLRDPVEIAIAVEEGNAGKGFAMPTQLNQHFAIVEQRYRLVTLACFLRLRALKGVRNWDLSVSEESLPACKMIVFFSTCDSVDFHYELFKRAKLPSELKRRRTVKDDLEALVSLKVFRIHGNHAQADRMESLRSFRKCARGVLLCTDVAARGLDLKGLTFAVQYDPPTGGQGEELEYLHRAGRTARMGERGDALLFLLPSEKAYIGKLESRGVSIEEISGSAALAALYPKVDLSDQGSISYATRLVTAAVQESFESVVKDDEEMKRIALAGYQAYCRAYATHAKEVRYFFHVRNLHLGHVARAFTLSDKPAEFGPLMAGIKREKAEAEAEKAKDKERTGTKNPSEVARAIVEGRTQPYNDQSTALSRRRREKGGGQEAFKELAMEFGA